MLSAYVTGILEHSYLEPVHLQSTFLERLRVKRGCGRTDGNDEKVKREWTDERVM
jgi:hypothetical protein